MPNFPTLATLWHPALVRYCYRVLGSWEDAEDAASEALINAWRAWERQTFAADADAVRWLYHIARNVCLDAVRKRVRRPIAIEAIAEWIVAPVDVEQEVLAGLDVAAMLAALTRMEPDWREALTLWLMGYGKTEAAAMSGRSVNTAGSRLYRARAAMRRELGEVA